MLFADLSYNLLGEVCIESYFLGFRVQPLLQQCLDLDIVLHLMQFEESFLILLVGGKHVDSVFFDLHTKNLWIWLT